MQVSDIMTREVATVRTNEKASVAARLMWDCDCGALPVLDETARAVAVITDRDICMATLFQDRPPSQFPVSLAMSLVDSDRRLVGIVSLADIVRATASAKGGEGKLPSDEVTATLLDICAPRSSGESRPATS